MRGFARRATVDAALAWLDSQLRVLEPEQIPLDQAARRVLAMEVCSSTDVPQFDRAMMDGFAVQAESVEGAAPYSRMRLEVIGQSLPGRPFAGRVGPQQAVAIMTGAPLPAGADSVLPAELAEVQAEALLAHGEVPPGKNIGRRGEDIQAGATVLTRGRVLRPQDLGVLASIGFSTIEVVRRPRVNVLVTGNELLPPGTRPRDFCIGDANGPMLAALVKHDGGRVVSRQILADDREKIRAGLEAEADVVLVSGGSSVGLEDHVPVLVGELGQLAVHGIAMRPSSPTGMGTLGNRLVFLLPGNPVSCLCAYDFFAGRAIRVLGGHAADWPYKKTVRPLSRKISSVIGRVDYTRVKVENDRVEPLAIAGASILSSTTRADGFVVVPADSEGYPPGAEVDVWLYD